LFFYPAVQICTRLIFLFIIFNSVVVPELLAQFSQPPLPPLTRGVTHESWTPDIPGLTRDTSLCRVSDDPTYGATADNPVKVGGGAMYVAARSKQFLHALRGPSGEGLHFKRLGSFEHSDEAMLDVYLIEFAGAARHVYVDGYRWAEPLAPRGLLCGKPHNLDHPRPDPFETHQQRIRLAAALDPSMTGPISLDADGSATHGIAFDYARLIGRAFAAAAAGGHPLDVEELPPTIKRPHFVVVAYPLKCEGRDSIAPESVKVSDARGNSPRVMKQTSGTQIQDLVPGFTAPPTAVAVAYDADLASPGQVEITYAEVCGTASRIVTLPIQGEPGRITRRVAGQVPSGVVLPPTEAQVRVQLYFDFAGMPHFAAYAGGPGTLAGAAVAAATEFRADPPRVNGAPILQVSTISVAFQP
jgi:hypothetical protein